MIICDICKKECVRYTSDSINQVPSIDQIRKDIERIK